MTDVGRTALSVEMRTNACAPNSPAERRDPPGREDVVLDRLRGVRLHHRNVLVRRRVHDDMGPVLREEGPHPDLVAAVRHERLDRRVAEAPERPDELLFDVEEGELGALHEEDARRPEPRDLARELGADRASRTRHHDGLAVEKLVHRLAVELDRAAPEQVLDLDVADPAHLHAALEDLGDARSDAHLDRHLLADLDQPEDLRTLDLRDRDDDLLDAEGPDDLSEVPRRSEDGEPVERPCPAWTASSSRKPCTSRSVSSRPSTSRAAARPNSPAPMKRVGTRGPSFPARPPALPLGGLVEDSPEEAHPEHPEETEVAAHQDHGDGHAKVPERGREREAHREEEDRGPREGEDERLELAHADVPPDEAVDAGEGERGNLQDEDDGQLLRRPGEIGRGNLEVESKEICEEETAREDQHVQDELEAPRNGPDSHSFDHEMSPTLQHTGAPE